MSNEAEDPILDTMIEDEVDRALDTPKGRALPREMQEETRVVLRLGLRHSPQARALLEQLRPRYVAKHSGAVATGASKDAKGTKVGGAR